MLTLTKTKLKTLAVLLLIAAVVLVNGCTSEKPAKTKSGNEPTKVVTDFLGRQVKIPLKVNRIGCLYAFSGHVVAMLGRGTDIVAVVDGLKRDKLLTEMVPDIKQALMPSSSGAINIEELIRANPDLVFVRTDTAKNPGEVEKLQKAGIPYLVVDYRNMKEQQATIEMIGQAIGEEVKAKRFVTYYNDCLSQVTKRVSKIPEAKRVKLYHSVNEAVRTDTRDSLPADWTQAAGAVNVSVNKQLRTDEEKSYASLEQIFLWDPDVIIANEMGVADYIKQSQQWSGLRAVKNNKVYQMPNGVSRWGHPGSLETPLALLWTAKILYPERFGDIDMVRETQKFYQEFWDFQISKEAAGQILAGEGMRISKPDKGQVDYKNSY